MAVGFACDASAKLKPTKFQKTVADIPELDRQKITQIGYEPYLDSKAFYEIQLKEEEKNLIQKSEARRIQDLANMSRDDYCEIYPHDQENCHQTQPCTPDDTTARRSTTPIRNAINDKSKRGGQCTTPQKGSDYFCNDICTSGKYADTNPAFEKATSGTLRVEGGFAPFSQARGGDTKYGITKKYNPDVDIENLTPEGAQDIMYETYYSQQHIYKLPDYVRGTVFDMNFMSPKFTWPTLCKRLGAKCEDYVTDEMAELAENYPGDLVKDLLDDYQIFFEEAATRGDDGPSLKQGWLNRVKLLRTNGCHYPTKPEEALYRPDSPKHND